jgi:hypothetical protein
MVLFKMGFRSPFGNAFKIASVASGRPALLLVPETIGQEIAPKMDSKDC